MPGRSKKKEARKRRLEEEGIPRRIREQAERQVAVSVWDRDPIKQYIRRFGWLEVIKNFVERQKGAGVDRPLKYLTIPGSNASDIGLLWQADLLTRTSEGFPDVAICDKTSAEEVLANLGGLKGYSSRSFYEAVKYPQGELCSLFPFDVINLDLCGAIITGAEKRNRALKQLVSIRWIFRLQRGQGFLLLLTASADDRSAHDTLQRVLMNNLNSEDKFKETYQSRYGVLDPEPYLEDYRSLVQLVVPKVIARMARDCGYRVLEHFAAKYDRQHHEMFCHSFEFEFLGRKKAAKKYEPYFDEIQLDEVSQQLPSQLHIQAINAYADFISTLVQRDPKRIEGILDSDTELTAELTDEASLLIGWWKYEE